jgi:hypothetical protein
MAIGGPKDGTAVQKDRRQCSVAFPQDRSLVFGPETAVPAFSLFQGRLPPFPIQAISGSCPGRDLRCFLAVDNEPTRLVVGEGMRAVEAAGVQPDTVRSYRPGPLRAHGQQMAAEAPPDEAGQQAEVHNLHVLGRLRSTSGWER